MTDLPTTIRDVLEKASDGISLKEAADRLGVTTQTIRNWIRTGNLPATKFGPPSSKIVRVDPTDLEALRRPA